MKKTFVNDDKHFLNFMKNVQTCFYSLIDSKLILQEKFIMNENRHSREHFENMIKNNLKHNGRHFLLFLSVGKSIFIINQINQKYQKSLLFKIIRQSICLDQTCKEEFDTLISENDCYHTFQIDTDNFIPKITIPQIKTIIINTFIMKGLLLSQKNKSSDYRFNEFSKMRDFIKFKFIKNFVYLSYNLNDQKIYILKQCEKENEKSKKCFIREILFYEKMENKYSFIPKYFGTIGDKNEKYIVIEFIEGVTLDQYIKSNKGKISHMDKIRIIIQLLIIVECIQFKGILLRDLKPDNLIINPNKKLFLIDFNSSKKYNIYEESTIDVSSLMYMSPEHEVKCTFKSDIYSIGLIILFILTEDANSDILNPFFLHNVYKSKGNILNSKELLPFPKEFNYLKNSLSKCLNYCPDERPTITELFIDTLQAIKAENLLDDIQDLLAYHIQLIFSVLGVTCDNCTSSIIEYHNGFSHFVHYLKIASLENNTDAQYLLGKIFSKKIFTKKDTNKAVYYLTLAANQNYSNAQYLLGKIYSKGISIQRNIEKAIELLKLSSEQNNPLAQYLLGKIYIKGEYITTNYDEAIKYLTDSANNNNPKAQYILGHHYSKYPSSYNDIIYAIDLLNKSANQKNSDAQYLLGLIFYEGKIEKMNINKSIHFFKLAAEQDNPIANFILGLIYYEGKYIKRNINEALFYLNKSSKLNDSSANVLLGVIYYEGIYVTPDVTKAIQYFSLNEHFHWSQCNLGIIYYQGKYNIKKDIYKAIELFTLAAECKNRVAQYYLGLIYSDGIDVHIDINIAMYYLHESASQGFTEAQFQLGLLYFEDEYIKRDIEKAIHFFFLAAIEKHSEASFYLGMIYYSNEFVKKDINKAIYYLQISAEKLNPHASFLLAHIYYTEIKAERSIFKKIFDLYLHASSMEHSFAKNNIGVIYKIGWNCTKDVNRGVSYFKEAIKLSKDKYSIFNLVRIYYFDNEYSNFHNKEKKIVHLLSSNGSFLFTDLFLFYIFLVGKNTQMRNKTAAKIYYKKIMNYYQDETLKKIVSYIYQNRSSIGNKLTQFMEQYDLVYSPNHSEADDFIFFIKDDQIWKNDYQNNSINNNTKKINNLFYEGLGDIK